MGGIFTLVQIVSHKSKMGCVYNLQKSFVLRIVCNRRVLALNGRAGNKLPGPDKGVSSFGGLVIRCYGLAGDEHRNNRKAANRGFHDGGFNLGR